MLIQRSFDFADASLRMTQESVLRGTQDDTTG